jgi:DHA1 family arabinose polymer transporter-like MFS transporter
MINAARGSEMLASSSLQASANTGNALGAFLGGLPLAWGYTYISPMYVGASLAFAGFMITVVLGLQKLYEHKTYDLKQIRISDSLKGS